MGATIRQRAHRAFSAMTVACDGRGLVFLLFPMYFLKSFRLSGHRLWWAFAAIAAIVVVARGRIALLDDRLDSLDTRRRVRYILSRHEPERQTGEADVLVSIHEIVMRPSIPRWARIVRTELLLLGAPSWASRGASGPTAMLAAIASAPSGRYE